MSAAAQPVRDVPRPPHSDLARRYGPAALVTGASDGIGRAFAAELAAAGLDLLLVARRDRLLAEIAADLAVRHGVRVEVLAADLGDPDAVARVAAAAEAMDIGLLVAAAGFGTSGPFLANALEEELSMLDVNCRAVLALTHRLGQRFAARGRGGVVLMSSILAFHGAPYAAHYAATKAYIQSLAEGLAVEWKPRGVDVIASAPGPTRSGFAARAGMVMDRAEDPATVARATLAALGRGTTVRPGLLTKLLAGSLATAPRPLRVRIMAGIMAKMAQRPRSGDAVAADGTA